MSIIIQDTWNSPEELELVEYLTQKGLNYSILNRAAITKLDIKEISIPFFDTDLVLQLLDNVTDKYALFECYPSELSHFYHRNIQHTTLSRYTEFQKPYFIKSKLFSHTIDTDRDIEIIREIFDIDDCEVYYCEQVNFISKYRMFVANGGMAGVVDATNDIFGYPSVVLPPVHFLRAILACNTYKYCVIDVGQLDTGTWCIMEVTPPFSLSIYGWEMDKYTRYCQQAWEYIKETIPLIVKPMV